MSPDVLVPDSILALWFLMSFLYLGGHSVLEMFLLDSSYSCSSRTSYLPLLDFFSSSFLVIHVAFNLLFCDFSCKAHSMPRIYIPHSSSASLLSAFIGSALSATKPLGLTLFINWKGGRSDSIVSPDTTRSFMAKKYWKFVKLFTQTHMSYS